MNRIKKSIINFINLLSFCHFLFIRNIFKGDSPKNVLLIIKKFISLEAPYYPNSYYLGRSVTKSSELLGALVDSYMETKSEVTLNQLLEVLKEEFIQRREKHGRKQF